jgi:L-threonylcarbamoyladenylate synthase
MSWNDLNLIEILKEGGVAVMPTDTIYGIVARAENKEAVERIYKLRKRAPDKPCIILIADIAELSKFSIQYSEEQRRKFKDHWPGPVSIILNCPDEKFSYLHRGTKTLAFRIPAIEEMRNFLEHTGPLVAPSANAEGQPPAKNIAEARKYFGNDVDIYVDQGELAGEPSRVIKMESNGNVTVLRG